MWLISTFSLQRNELDPRKVYVNFLLDKVPLGQVSNRGLLSFRVHHFIFALNSYSFSYSQPCKIQILEVSVPML